MDVSRAVVQAEPAASASAPKLLEQRWLRIAAALLLIVFGANQFAQEWQLFRYGGYSDPAYGDFPHYYIAAKLAGMAGYHQLYYPPEHAAEEVFLKIDSSTEWGRLAHENGVPETLHFSAPPIVAALMIPIGKLPFKTAYLVWRLLCDLWFFLAIALCLQICRALNSVTLLVCTFAGFFFQPFLLTLEKGQFGSLLLLLWAGGTLQALKKRDLSSALLFALATIVKMTPILAVGVFLLRRRWKWLAAYAVSMILLMGIGVWQTGMENHRLYLQEFRLISCGVPGPYNYSLAGIVQNLHYMDFLRFEQVPGDTPAAICWINRILGISVYAGTLFVLFRRNRGADFTWDLIVMSLVTLLIAPFTWRHYYVLELLPLMFVWFLLREGRFIRPNAVLWITVGSTLIASTRYADYLQTHLTYGPVRVLLVALLPLSALALMLTLLFAYQPDAVEEVLPGRRPQKSVGLPPDRQLIPQRKS